MSTPSSPRAALRADMETNRAAFHALLAALSEADLARPSANPAFSVKEIMHHMVQSLQVVPWEARAARGGHNLFAMPQRFYDVLMIPVTRLNALFQSKASLARGYDAAHTQAVQALESVPDSDWARPLQMFYVHTTLEDVFRRQAQHIAEHAAQVKAGLNQSE